MCCTRTRKRDASKEGGNRNGEWMKEVDQERYKYLGVLQLHKTMNKEMKENIGNECIRRVKLICKSNLNAGNFISGLNAWAIGVMRYSRGIMIGHK